MDSKVWQAREAHLKVCEHANLGGRFRAERNRLIRELYATGDYSYSQLANRIGCGVETIAKVCQGRDSTGA